MYYTYCSSMFTNGQKNRVYSYLNRSTAQRNNLCRIPNLIATGTNDTTPSPCAPIADFSTLQRFVCLGESVEFEDNSYNGTVTGRLWTFQHANITTDTSRLVNVIFNTVGWQTATLQVMNSEGTATVTKTLVYVAPATAQYTAPYFTSFEDTAQVSQTWTSINIDDDAPYFHPVSNAAHWGNSSILLNNFNSEVIWNEDDLISPAFDCSALTDSTCQISFWYSSATQVPSFTDAIFDSMEVSISTNCGLSWTNIKHLGGANIENGGSESGFYIPTTGSTWTKLTIPFSQSYITSSVRFKIAVFGTNKSNNLYIDDFNIGDAPTGIDQPVESKLTVFPNPFNSEITICGLAPSIYRIAVSDITGQTVFNTSEISPDKNGSAIVDLSAIHSAGIYFIRVANNTTIQTLIIIKT
jgi:Secretion system C-terminal sorting domain